MRHDYLDLGFGAAPAYEGVSAIACPVDCCEDLGLIDALGELSGPF